MGTKLHSVLKNIFGYDTFRPLQKEIIKTILNRQDTLVIMPTGGGKSLCYQIPALIFEGITIVVSPLISLMKDQVEQLKELGIPAVMLNSSLSPEEYSENVSRINDKKVKLLYVAPETLMMERTTALLSKHQISCITVDEAHCISEWGHDFRPDYREIAKIRENYSDSVLLGFTATATPRVQDDIIKNLQMKNPAKFVASFDRKNLYIQVVQKRDAFGQALDFLNEHKNESGIIYCFSRRQVDELYEELFARKFSVRPYHAGLSDAARKRNQELFIKDDVQIIVATIAFGMGINKPNVRFVVHFDLPKNIESYYQEIGRAGRDGLTAHCLLLFSYADIRKIKYFIDQKESEKERKIAKMHLDSLVNYAESFYCRRIPLLGYFGEKYDSDRCGMCDNCDTDLKNLTDITIEAQKFLSCIKRTGEYFGAMHITDVLRGSKSAKIFQRNHDKLSTYGIGTDISKENWLNLSQQFIQNNLITRDPEHGGLKITEAGFELLQGKRKVKGKIETEEIKFAAKPKSKIEFDKGLFEELRTKRKQIADKSGIPPYVIFPDRSLIEMAAYYPRTIDELRKIHGVGRVKLDNYGAAFLMVINTYVEKMGITQKFNKPKRERRKRLTKIKRFQAVGDIYKSGKSIGEILDEQNFTLETLLKHLTRFVREGNKIDTERLRAFVKADEDMQSSVFDQFENEGAVYLSPVYEFFGGEINYLDLHILRICFLNEKLPD